MMKFSRNTLLRLIRRRTYASILIVIGLLFVVWISTKSIPLMMLSLFIAGLFLASQAISGKKLKSQFTASAILCFATLGFLWVTFPDDRVLWEEEVNDLTSAISRIEDEVVQGLGIGQDSGGGDSLDQQGNSLHEVVSVTDGDTIRVRVDGQSKPVRIIGIDTPEVYGGVECYGREASARMEELVEGGRVRLEADPSQGDVDGYDRLLRFVFSEDGRDVGRVMLEEGLASEYTYNKRYKYTDEYIQAEADAKENELGIWSRHNC